MIFKKQTVATVAALLAVFLAGTVYFYQMELGAQHNRAQVGQSSPSTVPAARTQTSTKEEGSVLATSENSANEEAPDSISTFRVDTHGNLLIDEQTRLKIEELIALTDPNKLYELTREKTKDLPPAAARKAEELVERLKHFQIAQRQSFPPGVAPLTEEDALLELDGLHALREAHFGTETASAFYGREEKLSRELIELMKNEKDQSLTLAEKADRAQRLVDRSPTLSTIEARNKEEAKKLGE